MYLTFRFSMWPISGDNFSTILSTPNHLWPWKSSRLAHQFGWPAFRRHHIATCLFINNIWWDYNLKKGCLHFHGIGVYLAKVKRNIKRKLWQNELTAWKRQIFCYGIKKGQTIFCKSSHWFEKKKKNRKLSPYKIYSKGVQFLLPLLPTWHMYWPLSSIFTFLMTSVQVL